MALKARKQVAAKQKEAEKRQNETLSRKNLAGLRVVQKNLVYVVGLNLTPRQKEDDLLKILRGPEFFGQYGKIIKIVVSKAKEGATANSIGVYVTFARKEDAESCISAVDGTTNVDRVLRYASCMLHAVALLMSYPELSMVPQSTVPPFFAMSNVTTEVACFFMKLEKIATASVDKTYLL
jgi:hypothetical protein